MKYLITGRNGQLAAAFIRRFEEQSVDFLAPEERNLDITDPAGIFDLVSNYRPDVIINCAAYNLVDLAEREYDKAFKINAAGPRLLAAAAKRYGSRLLHFGTDYVFDGSKEDGLYGEEDAVNPLNEYGKSKLSGERWVMEETDQALIFRLSWVFGEGRQNFIRKLLEWMKNNSSLKISCDEFSVPTYTYTVADVSLRAIAEGLTGLYHLTNSGFCSRYEWATFVARRIGASPFIRPVSMDVFDLPAKRAKFSAMSNGRISSTLGFVIPPWEEAVAAYLDKEGIASR